MKSLMIGEVARRAGIRASAIRYYESAGLLPRARRVGGKRRYGPDIFQRLAVIRLAQDAGFTIAEIRTLTRGLSETAAPSARWRQLAARKLAELALQRERLDVMTALLEQGLRCECVTLDACQIEAIRSAERVG